MMSLDRIAFRVGGLFDKGAALTVEAVCLDCQQVLSVSVLRDVTRLTKAQIEQAAQHDARQAQAHTCPPGD